MFFEIFKGQIVIQINSGLGNQMFQYAFGKALGTYCNRKVYFDVVSDFATPSYRKLELEPFNIEINKANIFLLMRYKRLNEYHLYLKSYNVFEKFFIRITRKYLNNTIYAFLKMTYRSITIDEKEESLLLPDFCNNKNIYIKGYFQNVSFLKTIESEMRKNFKLKIDYLSKTNIALQIANTNSVSIHVRRGDYLEHSSYTLLSLDYYFKSVDYIIKRISRPTFFVFSDDISWVKNIFCEMAQNFVYIDQVFSNNACDDLLLMSYCKHNIIANSTYSWWGAWLNQNSNKLIIAPSTWYNDTAKNNDTIEKLIPKNWIII